VEKNSGATPIRDQGETSIGATLHQLAVIATFGKRYDDAERLLQQVLALEAASNGVGTGAGTGVGGGTSSDGKTSRSRESTRQLVSRAAATQQLGRVYFRRGQLQQAKSSLQESLAIYTKAYGEMQHINVAAVHHQLGNTLSTLENHAEAEEHFNKALSIRLAVFPTDHIEVIRTYTELAQCITDKGPGHALMAEAFWEKQQERVENALQRVQVGALVDSTAHAMEISHLARHLLSALYARRVYYRRRKDLAMVAELSTSIAYARKLQDGVGACDQKEAKLDDLKSVSVSSTADFVFPAGLAAPSTGSTLSDAVRQAVLATRTAVRTQAKALLASSADAAAAEAIMSSLSKGLAEILEPALASVEEDEEAAEVAGQGQGTTGTYKIVHGNKPLLRAARRLCADVDTLLRVADEQLRTLRVPIPVPLVSPASPLESDVHNTKGSVPIVKVLANGLFKACDRLREEVQALGETVED